MLIELLVAYTYFVDTAGLQAKLPQLNTARLIHDSACAMARLLNMAV